MKEPEELLAELVEADPAALKRVDVPVDRRFGVTAYGARLDAAGRFPALLFTDVAGAELPCLANLLATHERMALALGVGVEELATSSAFAPAAAGHPPVRVEPRRRR